MISADQCRAHLLECVTLAAKADISTQRARLLLAMSRTWAMLGTQTERYETMLKEEGKTDCLS